jgi:vancomycin permeability regulator SanA
VKKALLLIVLLVIASPFLARAATALAANGRVFTELAQVPAKPVAVVYGAGIRNGQPTAVLYDRVAAAAALYQAGVVGKLLMSGDNRFANYNEPAAMRRTALQLGVPDEDIVLDLAGRSTYETCYRAHEIFGVNAAVLVTQDFHLDRAIATCRALGIDAVGFVADRRAYRGMAWFQFRELGATLNAFVELFITRPTPVLGDKLPIV